MTNQDFETAKEIQFSIKKYKSINAKIDLYLKNPDRATGTIRIMESMSSNDLNVPKDILIKMLEAYSKRVKNILWKLNNDMNNL